MNYDFPVSLQPAFTKTGFELPRVKAVVREDTGEAIAAVSNRYRLIEHKDIMDQARKYVGSIGAPIENFHIANKGARVVGEFTYKDIKEAIRPGELVGLRVYVENTYNAKGSMKLRIGGINLVCLNGMTQPKDIFDLSVRHTGKHEELKFPEPEIVIERFRKTVKDFGRLLEIDLADGYKDYAEKAHDEGVVVKAALEAPTKGTTAWDLYNQFTYHVTHSESAKATPIGKLNRLNRVTSWFDKQFPIN